VALQRFRDNATLNIIVYNNNKKHLKNVGPFATASRRTPHCHSPGVASVASHADVHNNNDDDDNDSA